MALEKPEIMTRGEVAAYLRVSLSTVERMMRSGKLRAVRVCGQYRFRRCDVLKALDQMFEDEKNPVGHDASMG